MERRTRTRAGLAGAVDANVDHDAEQMPDLSIDGRPGEESRVHPSMVRHRPLSSAVLHTENPLHGDAAPARAFARSAPRHMTDRERQGNCITSRTI